MRLLTWTVLPVAAALACIWAVARWAYTPYACARSITELTRRTQLASETGAEYTRLRRIRANLAELSLLAPQCGTDVRIPMLIGANHELLGRYEEAIASYRQALVVNPRPEIHTAMADSFIQLGRTDEAVAQYAVAARFNPAMLDLAPSEEVRRRVMEKLRERR